MKLIFLILPLISLLAISCKVSDADSDPSGNPVNVAIVDIDASNLFGNACSIGQVEIETEAVPDGTEIEIDESSSDACLLEVDVLVDDGVATAEFVVDYVLGIGNVEFIPITISLLLDDGTMFEQFTNIPVTGIGIAPPTSDEDGSTTFDVEAAAEDDPDMAPPTPFIFIPVGLAGKLDDLVAEVSNIALGGIVNVEVLPNGDIFVEYQPNNGTEGTNIITVTVTLTTPPEIQNLCPMGTIGDGAVVTAFITINQTAAEPGMVAMMEADCGNSIDDDGDMMVDCFDPDCAMDPICEIGGPETMCSDMVDNDADMSTDCLDADCDMNTDCETGDAECTAGADEDMDGLVNCEDPGCDGFDGENGDGTGDPCEFGVETLCNDGFDNDADTLVDCADDTDCNAMGMAIAPCENDNETICDDGIDNDGDGMADCADPDDCPDMAAAADVCTADEDTQVVCDDDFDNDGDTLVDCADDQCDTLMGSDGQVCEPAGEMTCDDTFDNDGDGLADCADVMDCPDTTACEGGGMCNAGVCDPP